MNKTPDHLRRMVKGLRLLSSRRYRAGLRKGVAATIEHKRVKWTSTFITVIDVGANRGQFALFALEEFPNAHIYAFEPLSACVDVLREATRRDGGRVSIFQTAVGATSGFVPFHVSARDDSSSVLEIGSGQVGHFPGTEPVGVVRVPLETLDRSLSNIEIIRPCLLKIDVQGSEFDVLRGSTQTLACVDELLVELSFVELYLRQHLAPDVFRLLAELSFYPTGIYGLSIDDNRRPIQADVHFSRLGHSLALKSYSA